MSSVETVVQAAMALTREELRAVHARLGEALDQPVPWPAILHPAWKAEIARRDAMPEDDDIPSEQVEREMQLAIDEVDRERDARGEG